MKTLSICRLRSLLPLAMLALCLGTSPGMSAQQKKLRFEMVEFKQDPFDTSARDPQHKIKEFADYAIIKVKSDNPDDDLMAYQFNFGYPDHRVVLHDDALWVYVQKNAKWVTISRDGYVTKERVDLKHTLQPGSVYRMVLSSEMPVVKNQMVQFNVSPAESKAKIKLQNVLPDSEEIILDIDANGQAARNLPYGTYDYKVISENYHPSGGQITLDNELETLQETVPLKARFAGVTLQAEPGVEIIINGERKGVGSWTGNLRSGSYTVITRKTNHRESKTNITVADNETRTFTLNAPEPITGTLSVTSTPLGADIIVDGVKMGVTPRNLEVIIGSHKIELAKEGYNNETFTEEIKEKQTSNINATLKSIGTVSINSYPREASVYIDGRFIGLTPCEYTGNIGNHHIELKKHGYHTLSKTLSLRSLDDKEHYSLKELMFKKTGFYAEVGFCAGAVMGPEVDLGVNIGNVNVELDFAYGLNKSKTVYWINLDGTSDNRTSTYTPAINVGVNVGYNIVPVQKLSLTPQIGARLSTIKDSGDFINTYACDLTLGVRCAYAFTPHFGVFLTPRYGIKMAGGNGLKTLDEAVSGLGNLGSGFTAAIGLYLSF